MLTLTDGTKKVDITPKEIDVIKDVLNEAAYNRGFVMRDYDIDRILSKFQELDCE